MSLSETRSPDPFYIIVFNRKWVKISWTNSIDANKDIVSLETNNFEKRLVLIAALNWYQPDLSS